MSAQRFLGCVPGDPRWERVLSCGNYRLPVSACAFVRSEHSARDSPQKRGAGAPRSMRRMLGMLRPTLDGLGRQRTAPAKGKCPQAARSDRGAAKAAASQACTHQECTNGGVSAVSHSNAASIGQR